MGRNNYRQQNYTLNRGSGNEGIRKYDQHDDRSGDGSSRGSHNRVWNRLGSRPEGGGNRQVSFGDEGKIGIRNRGNFKRGRGRHNNQKIHVILPEDDDGMGDRDQESRGDQAGRGRPMYRGGPRGGGRGYKYTRGGPGRTPPGLTIGGKTNASSVFSWQKVVLKNGTRYDKLMLLKELLNKANTKFIPICYSKQGMNTYFYLEDQAAAKALKDLDKKIEMPDGYPLQISIERSTPPNMPLTEELVDKVKQVMSSRYTVGTQALNLKSFHMDEAFAGESFYAPLWRSNVMNKVLTVITDHIPEIKAIDLSCNKLTTGSMEFFSGFKSKLSNLTLLYLCDNKITTADPLQRLKGLPLEELKLTGNPIIQNLGSSYTEVIRKIFPKLKILDGKELAAIISFDDDEDKSSTDLPQSISKYVKNADAEGIVLTFLQEYFKVYDSDKRQSLLDAYHENAMFSMSAFGKHELLSSYIPESRNLLRVDYEKKRHDLLKKGKLSVVAFLDKLPKTEHDLNTFTLDVPFNSDTMMIFTITGCFKERGSSQNNIRHFNRCFIVVPQNSGFCIINETLFVTPATDLSKRKPFLNKEPAPAAASTSLDEATKRSLATSFSQKSGMSLEWAVQCLEQNSWDFDKAGVNFNEAKAQGKIPPEAFIS